MAVDVRTLVGSSSSRTAVTSAIQQAAQVTGASFDYLLATAKVESNLNPELTVRTSSATGLFQFIEQTWLATLKQGGPAFGYGTYADAISRTPSGRYVVEDPALRDEIMRLRKDPTANALMGAVFTQQNAAELGRRIGRMPTEGELYVAHFFGPYAAAKAITLAASDPTANAAAIFPAPAAANRSIFYDKQGYARSIAGVCAELMRRYEVARTTLPAPAPQLAARAPLPPRPPAEIPAPVESRRAPPLPAPDTAALHDLMFSSTPAQRRASPVPMRQLLRFRVRRKRVRFFIRCSTTMNRAPRLRPPSARCGAAVRTPRNQCSRHRRHPATGGSAAAAPPSICSATRRATCADVSTARCDG
jgi:hypothetical protein